MATVLNPVRLSVSVYLLKAAKVAEAQTQLEAASAEVYPLVDSIPGGAFIALPAEAEPPRWLDRLTPLLDPNAAPDIEGQSPGAVLWVPRGTRTFVFTFGYGHSKVKHEWVEPDFGKTVALSVIPQGEVREVRAEQVFARRHVSSERAPKAAAVREFGFEPDRDLVSAVEGIPEIAFRALLGPKVRGGVSFKFDLIVDRLLDTLDQLVERYDSNDHRRRWPQANNLVPARDSDQIDQLDGLLAPLLTAPGAGQSISLAAPIEVSGDKPYPRHFVIGRLNPNPATSPFLLWGAWERYLRGKGIALDLAAAKSTRVHLLDENREQIDDCSIYDCIGAEVTSGGKTFVLSSGNWYEADLQFIANTNSSLATLTQPPHALPTWNRTDHEEVYNEGACTADNSLWLFDQEMVYFGGAQSKFEFCDMMHPPTRTLYFVKHPTASAGVSHLCEQVRRTIENFFSTDPSYRDSLRARIETIGRGWDVTWLNTRPRRHEWNLCLVLMGKNPAQLPFFAKCGIARLLGELQRGGYNVFFQAV